MFWECYGDYHGRRALKTFLPFFHAKLEKSIQEAQFRVYITDALYYAPRNQWMSKRFVELIDEPKKPKDNRSGDEVAAEVIKRLGLKFKNNTEGKG